MGWELTKSKLPLCEMRIYSKFAAAEDKIDNPGRVPRKPMSALTSQMKGPDIKEKPWLFFLCTYFNKK